MKLLFPEAEVTRSLSNVIKAYTVRYKEEQKLIDVGEREEAIHAKVAESILANSFVGGLQAIELQADSEIPAIAYSADGVVMDGEAGAEGVVAEEGAVTEEGAVDGEGQVKVMRPMMDAAALEAWREEERQKLKVELTAAERIAIKIEMEKAIRTQADVILEQARAQGEQVKAKARQQAEEECELIREAARREAYEEGRTQLEQDREAQEMAFAERERQLTAEFERMASELEPKAVEVVVGLLENLTGVCLESRKGIVSYLVTKALTDADRSNMFLIKVSKDDLEEVKGISDSLRALFEREVTLEVVQDVLLKKGECMIETDSNIIDCSLGTQLEGLIEDIRLLGVQERV